MIPDVVWRPQSAPQKALVDCPFSEVFFGGARGGGKTDGVLGKWALKEAQYGTKFNAVMFRKTTVSSEDAIERSKEIYGPLGGKFNEAKLRWRLPHGGRVAFAYLDTLKDADAYQGRNLTDAWVDEGGQYADPAPIDRLFGVLRGSIPVQLIVTANPGGAGQHWIAVRYGLIPFPTRPQVRSRTLPNGHVHRYAVIPSRLTDNRVLMHVDPNYVNRLQMVGSAALVRAWLDGDWTAVEGAFFDCWDPKRHVVEPFAVPVDWMRFRSFDWGSAKPFSVGWWAVAGDNHPLPGGRVLSRGALVRYREWYGSSAPNVGLKLTTKQVADGIRERDAGDKITYSVADPSIFAEDGGPARSEIFARNKVFFIPADNRRVARAGAMGGWDELRQRLVGENGQPMLVTFSTCRDLVRTLPALQHDPQRAEDVDTKAEDHAPDETRYAVMSRPWVPTIAAPPKKVTLRREWEDDEDADDARAPGWKVA